MEKTSYTKSVFKNQSLTKEAYTGKWIELINALEDQKGAAASHAPRATNEI